MSDRWTYVLAAATWIGALVGLHADIAVPVAVGVLGVAIALAWRRPALLLIACTLLAGARAVADRDGLVPPPPGPIRAWATLITDPVRSGAGAVQAEVRLGSRHLLATASADAAPVLAPLDAGERLLVSGSLARPPPGASWLERRHIVGRLRIDAVERVDDGPPLARLANALRGTLTRSAEALPDRQRGLYLGFVLGDDRDQPLDIVDDFRGSGLSHLLAVSGENVAFVLVLVGPALRRLALRPRWIATVSVIVLFALTTRYEPSVLRASVMAALAATATMLGREATGLRLLALAVSALVVADPFLVEAPGFQLSVAASAAILLLAARIAAVLPGPRAIAEAVAVSAAAQVGVAPILVATFGGAPVAGFVANLLAAPAAGPVMVWGAAAGVVGGVGGEAVAAVLHAPTRLLVGWIAVVADRTARWPLGQLGGREVVVLSVAVLLLVFGRGRRRTIAGVLATCALVSPGLAAASTPPVQHQLPGATLWRAGGGAVLVVGPRTRPADLLAGLREAGASRLDLVVFTASPSGQLVDAVDDRAVVGTRLQPGDLDAPARLQCGDLQITVEPSAGMLVVVVTAAGARDPPV